MNQTKTKKRNIDLLNGPIFSSLTSLAMPIMATAPVSYTHLFGFRNQEAQAAAGNGG